MTLVLTHHWPMDVPECSLLAVQDLPLRLVLLPVDPVNRGNRTLTCSTHTSEISGQIQQIRPHTLTNTHIWKCQRQARLGNKKMKRVGLNLSARLTKRGLVSPLVGPSSYITDIY